MNKRIAGCKGIYERIKAGREEIGLKTFVEVPTVPAQVEQLPICFMNYGVDEIIKRSSRSASPSRKSDANIRSVEVVLEIVVKEPEDVFVIFKELRKKVFVDIYPAVDTNGMVDDTVFIQEDRTEGPVGYGLPDVKAFVFVLKLVYPDEF